MADKLPDATRYALFASALGTGMVYLDQSAVAVALPAIQQGLGLEVSDLQWIMSLYMLFLTTPLLIFGVLGDRHGRVRLYISGLICFGCGSLICGLAGNLGILLVARALQGLGASMMIAVGLAILNANTPREIRGRVIGAWASLTSLVIAFGPALGGFVVDAASWRLVFAINTPMALIAITIALWKLPESHSLVDDNSVGVIDTAADAPSVLLLIVGLGTILLGLIEGPRFGWSLWIMLCLVVGLVLVGLFIARQRIATAPLIPAALFRHRVFAGINAVTLLLWLTIGAFFFFMPINLQQIQGFSATQSGLAILPVSLSVLIFSRFSGKLSDRFTAMPLIVIGIINMGVGLALFAHLQYVENYVRQLLPATLLFGVGLGLLVAPLTHVAMNALSDRHSGLASGVNNSASRLSSMLAVALFGSLMVSQFTADLGPRLLDLQLDPATMAAIMGNARDLGAMKVPVNLSAATTASIDASIDAAFFSAWKTVMWLCVAVCVISAVLAFLVLKKPRTN
ncbi:MAG: MFS transporter [marine bacterium B5-7]|nr:MAG: MFS transporter [marine bacterium B5-7]